MSSYSIIAYPGYELPRQYRGIVFSRWLRSLRSGNRYFKRIDKPAYYTSYRGYISLLLAKMNTVVRLAVITEEIDTVVGFSVSRGTKLDYVYVMDGAMRKQGIGTALVPPTIDTITHITNDGMKIWQSKHKDWKFNPFV